MRAFSRASFFCKHLLSPVAQPTHFHGQSLASTTCVSPCISPLPIDVSDRVQVYMPDNPCNFFTLSSICPFCSSVGLHMHISGGTSSILYSCLFFTFFFFTITTRLIAQVSEDRGVSGPHPQMIRSQENKKYESIQWQWTASHIPIFGGSIGTRRKKKVPCVVLPVLAVLFKTPRSGSTLLTSMLESDPAIKCIEEDRSLSSAMTRGDATRELHQLRIRSAPSQKSVFLNMNSQSVWHRTVLLNALPPNTRIFFLKRSFDVVGASLLRKPPSWARTYDKVVSYTSRIANLIVEEKAWQVYDYADVVSLELPYEISGNRSYANSWRRLLSSDVKRGGSFEWKKELHDRLPPSMQSLAYRFSKVQARFPIGHRHLSNLTRVTEAPANSPFQFDRPHIHRTRLDIREEPFSRMAARALRGQTQLWALKASFLAHRYMWYPPKMSCEPNYVRSSRWVAVNYSEWQQKRDSYIIGKCAPDFFPSVSSKRMCRLSHAGAVTPLHYDSSDSVLMQVKGVKTMVLWPPNVIPTYKGSHCLGRRSVFNLDVHPDLWKKAGIVVARIEPGDVLTFPSYWPHWTFTEEKSLSVGFRKPSEMKLIHKISQVRQATEDEIRFGEGKRQFSNGFFVSALRMRRQ